MKQKITILGILKSFDQSNDFETLYNEVRQKEQRILTVDQTKALPHTSPGFVHHDEWNLRIKSTNKLIDRINEKSDATVLDLGCGNGWLMFKLAQTTAFIAGVDVNLMELEQAEEVLEGYENTELYYGDIFEINFATTFDFIVLNASVQYFPDVKKLLNHLLTLLNPKGEIHIIDSPFYPNRQSAIKAKNRSTSYYSIQGVADMASFYYHHTLSDLQPFEFDILHDPTRMLQRIRIKWFKGSPLYWIMIKT